LAGCLAIGAAFVPVALSAVVPDDYGTVLTLFPVTIDDGPGDQYHAHVNGDLASYTSDSEIRYYDFFTGGHGAVPQPAGVEADWLNDVSGSKIVFSRSQIVGDCSVSCVVRFAITAYDTATGTTTEVDHVDTYGHLFFPSIGGDTVAYIDAAVTPGGEIVVKDLVTGTRTQLTTDTRWKTWPVVSPAGDLVVWESCSASVADCDIHKATRVGSSWVVADVTHNTDHESYPHTDGVVITYNSSRSGEQDIYWQLASGGPEQRLELPGEQRNPSVAGGLITFESIPVGSTEADLFAYQIATNRLFRITSTQGANEMLNDLTALPDGRFRVVWDDGSLVTNSRNVYGATFELPGVGGGSFSFGGFLAPVDPSPTLNSMKAGAAVPVKFSLGGFRGTDVFAAGYPKSSPVACNATALEDGVEQTMTAGESSLQYDQASDVYTYIWKTDKAWAGTCRQLVVRFTDFSTQYAMFKFK
jgi:hypothetical protein